MIIDEIPWIFRNQRWTIYFYPPGKTVDPIEFVPCVRVEFYILSNNNNFNARLYGYVNTRHTFLGAYIFAHYYVEGVERFPIVCRLSAGSTRARAYTNYRLLIFRRVSTPAVRVRACFRLGDILRRPKGCTAPIFF